MQGQPQDHRRPSSLPYMRSLRDSGLRETTKIGYSARIETLRAEHGVRTVAGPHANDSSRYPPTLTPTGQVPRTSPKDPVVPIRHVIAIGWLDHDPAGIMAKNRKSVRGPTSRLRPSSDGRPIGTKQRLYLRARSSPFKRSLIRSACQIQSTHFRGWIRSTGPGQPF